MVRLGCGRAFSLPRGQALEPRAGAIARWPMEAFGVSVRGTISFLQRSLAAARCRDPSAARRDFGPAPHSSAGVSHGRPAVVSQSLTGRKLPLISPPSFAGLPRGRTASDEVLEQHEGPAVGVRTTGPLRS